MFLCFSTSCYSIAFFTMFTSLWCPSSQLEATTHLSTPLNSSIGGPFTISRAVSKNATLSADSHTTPAGNMSSQAGTVRIPAAQYPGSDPTPQDPGLTCPDWHGLPWVSLRKSSSIVGEYYPYGGIFIIWCNINLPADKSANPFLEDQEGPTTPDQSLAQCIARCVVKSTSICTAVTLDVDGICYFKKTTLENPNVIEAKVNSTKFDGAVSAIYIPSNYGGNNAFVPPHSYNG